LGEINKMTRSGSKPMGISPRLINRMQSRGTRGNLIKSLAELIKNSDDAYDRLDNYQDTTHGIIEVAYDQIKTDKGFAIKGFVVRDFGSGMSYAKASSVYAADKSYGGDQSDETRNGAIGVGGKDCFYNLDNCFILTVHEGILTVVNITTGDEGLKSEFFTGDDATEIMTWANEILSRGGLETISLDKNQTIATFQIPKNHIGIRADTLVDNLKQFYTLRWILESDIRTVKLTDIFNKQTATLKHTPIIGELQFEKSLTISHKEIPYEVHIEINKSENDLKHTKDTGYGILIQSKRGAVLDNSMFGYANDSAASKFFGKVTISDWKKMHKMDGTVITDNREGLDYHNSFNKQIETIILTNLKSLIEKERQKQAENPTLNKNLDNNIQKALDLINQIILKDPDAGLEAEDEPDSLPEGMKFGLPSYTFTPEKTRKIKLFFDPGEVQTNSEIKLQLDNNNVTITPENSIHTPSSYDKFTSENKVPFVEISVYGKQLIQGKGTHSTLRAFYGKLEAETTIYIKPEPSLNPKNGFEFKPGKIILVPKTIGGKTKDATRKIKLRIDTNLILPGTSIQLSCPEGRINFSPEKLTVTNPPNAGKYLTEEIITISGKQLGIKTKLTAETITSNYEPRNATCEIKIEEKEPPRKFFKDYRFDAQGVPNVRSRFDRKEGIVYIHTQSPILKSVFGSNLERINDLKEQDALTLLADTIVQRVCFEWAKYLVEHDKVASLGNVEKSEEIERERGKKEYRYGLGLFQLIVSGKLTSGNQ
jgi:hypothetical protein